MRALLIGVSESLNGLGLPIEWVAPSVYEHGRGLSASANPSKVLPFRGATESKAREGKIRVLCVDDSPTVLRLLNHLVTADPGFEVIGTAADGLEAVEKIKTLKPDIVTLDIHMPKMSGVEFMEMHFKSQKCDQCLQLMKNYKNNEFQLFITGLI